MLRDLTILPLGILAETHRSFRYYGEQVRHDYHLAKFEQIRDILSLRIKTGLPPEVYYQLQLFLPDRRFQARDFAYESGKLLQALTLRVQDSSDFNIFFDKSDFEKWCLNNKLPSARTLVDFAGNQIIHHTPEPFPAIDLISKPTNWESGKGVRLWRHNTLNGLSSWSDGEITVNSAAELVSHIATSANQLNRPFVLQLCLTNHSVIRAMGNGALSTLRIMTLYTPEGTVEPLLAALRIPIGDSVTDNFNLGNLSTNVDLASGKCSKAVYKNTYPLERLESNPDTDHPIAGQTIPYVSESVKMVLRAHETLSFKWPVIGWDVAILEDGPVLLEANHMPGTEIVQKPTGIPLGSTRFVEALLTQMRAAFHV